MNRELMLKIVLVIAGVIFLLLAWPMVVFVRLEPGISMMFSVYVTLGVFLLLSVRRPAEHRSLIAFTAWSSLVHAVWMGAQAEYGMVAKGELIGCAVLASIGVLLVGLRPRAGSDPGTA